MRECPECGRTWEYDPSRCWDCEVITIDPDDSTLGEWA